MMERMPSEFWPDARLNVIADKIWQVFGRSPPPLPDEYFAFPFTAETLAFLPTRKLPPSMPEFAKRIRRIARWMVINGPYHCRDYDERLMQVIKTACSKDDTSNVKHFFQAAEIGLAGGPAFGPWMGFLGSVAWDGIMGPFKKLMTLERFKDFESFKRSVGYDWQQLLGPDIAGAFFGANYRLPDELMNLCVGP